MNNNNYTDNPIIDTQVQLKRIDEDIDRVDKELEPDTGILRLKETTTPSTESGYVKIYGKSDKKLYYKDGDGTEHEVSGGGGGGGGSPNTQFLKRIEFDHVGCTTPTIILSREEVGSNKSGR